MVVDEDDDILLISSEGVIIRIPAKEISRLGRATQGVKIMNVADDVNIIAMAKVIKDDELDGEEKSEETAPAADENGQQQMEF
jgi:DNA gyrase subunit A